LPPGRPERRLDALGNRGEPLDDPECARHLSGAGSGHRRPLGSDGAARSQQAEAEQRTEGAARAVDQWRRVKGVAGRVLAGQLWQLELLDLGEQLLELELVLAVLDEHPSGEWTGADSSHARHAPEPLDQVARELRFPVEAAYRDPRPPALRTVVVERSSPAPFEPLGSGRPWPRAAIGRSLRGHGGGVQNRPLVRDLPIEGDEHVPRRGVRPHALDAGGVG
jgi:hypothetical protein